MALVMGVPLIGVAAACFVMGLWHFAIYPLFLGLLLLFAPLITLFDEEHSFPECIPRDSIQNILANPPTRWKLSSFTITYLTEGCVRKTGFCLPCAVYSERAKTFQAVTEAFAQSGLNIEKPKNQNA